jgi:hypothetical protein
MAKNRKRYVSVGRPLIDPMNKLSQPFRALITPRVYSEIDTIMEETGMDQSNVLRLFVFEALNRRGRISPEMIEEDQTFKDLKEAGLV